jgi:hypothetical protein
VAKITDRSSLHCEALAVTSGGGAAALQPDRCQRRWETEVVVIDVTSA